MGEVHSAAATLAPRCNLDAEAAVLSAALLDSDAALELTELLAPEDFYADANRRVFEAILGLLQQGTSVDVVSASARLRDSNRLEQIGGTPYLAQLIDATPAIANLGDHAKLVRDSARVRRAGVTFQRLAAEAKALEIQDTDEWLESCESRACAATVDRGERQATSADYRDLAKACYEQITVASKAGKPTLGRSTGFQKLDEHIGGVEGGDLIVVAGRPGMGKTALALQITETIARDVHAPALGIVLSLEMAKERLMIRSLARVAGERARELRTGRPGNWSNVTEAVHELAKLPIIVDDAPGLTPLRLRSKVRRLHATLRARFPQLPLGVIVVDYIQLMGADDVRRGGTRTEEISQITRALKLTAKELNCTVLALSQFRRPPPGKSAPRPELGELRDSGSIEQDADVVLAIHRDDAYRKPGAEPDGKAELIVLKGRNSGEGVHFVRFDGARTAFFDEYQAAGTLPFTNGANNGHQHHQQQQQQQHNYDQRYP
jgi:replicative DNA helicase